MLYLAPCCCLQTAQGKRPCCDSSFSVTEAIHATGHLLTADVHQRKAVDIKKKKKAFIYYLHLLSPLASQQSDEVGPVSLVL